MSAHSSRSSMATPEDIGNFAGGVMGQRGAVVYPMLTRTNYSNWAFMMEVILESQGLWEAIEPEGADVNRREDRMAMAGILRAVPEDMISALTTKRSAKEMWESIKTMRLGSDLVRKARAQALRREFECLAFKEGEPVDDFALRLTSLTNSLATLNVKITEQEAVEKFLRVVPEKYEQLAISIESLLDLSTLTIEELTGRLKVAEDRHTARSGGSKATGGRLLLSGEEKSGRGRGRKGHNTSSSGGDHRRRGGSGKGRGKQGGSKEDSGESSRGARDVSRDECNYCGKIGHWARDCRKKKRDEQSNLVTVEDEQPALLMAHVDEVNISVDDEVEEVTIDEEHVHALIGRTGDKGNGVWYLDSGASNHMTGCKENFATLSMGVTGTVKFGDASVADIRGRGTVTFAWGNSEHRVLTDVYYIPKLRSNIISLGQLDEHGCWVMIHESTLWLHDQHRRLIAKVERAQN